MVSVPSLINMFSYLTSLEALRAIPKQMGEPLGLGSLQGGFVPAIQIVESRNSQKQRGDYLPVLTPPDPFFTPGKGVIHGNPSFLAPLFPPISLDIFNTTFAANYQSRPYPNLYHSDICKAAHGYKEGNRREHSGEGKICNFGNNTALS